MNSSNDTFPEDNEPKAVSIANSDNAKLQKSRLTIHIGIKFL